jgi:hypothetical protein
MSTDRYKILTEALDALESEFRQCEELGDVLTHDSLMWNRGLQAAVQTLLKLRALPGGMPPPQEPRAFDFHAHLERQREWSSRTFGPGNRTAGVVDHIRKELTEIEEHPDDLSEWADVVILGLDGFWRAGATPEQIIAAIVAKQVKNEARVWPDWRTQPLDKAIEHDRTHDAARLPGGSETPANGEWVFVHAAGEWRCHCGYISTSWDKFLAHFHAPPHRKADHISRTARRLVARPAVHGEAMMTSVKLPLTYLVLLSTGYWHARFGRESFVQWRRGEYPSANDVFNGDDYMRHVAWEVASLAAPSTEQE